MINATSLAIEQSLFMNNTALTGGGIYMSRVTDTYIYDTLFYSNNVTQEGGGIYSGMPPMQAALQLPFSTYLQIMKFAKHAISSLPLIDICLSDKTFAYSHHQCMGCVAVLHGCPVCQ